MNIENQSRPEPTKPLAWTRRPDPDPDLELAPFDPALHAAALRAQQPAAPVMAAGWWESVVCPEEPRALELRHIPGLPAADAARLAELFAEVVDAGGPSHAGGARASWEVLALWQLGSSPSAAAAREATMILSAREAEAEERAGSLELPSGFDERGEAHRRALRRRLGE